MVFRHIKRIGRGIGTGVRRIFAPSREELMKTRAERRQRKMKKTILSGEKKRAKEKGKKAAEKQRKKDLESDFGFDRDIPRKYRQP